MTQTDSCCNNNNNSNSNSNQQPSLAGIVGIFLFTAIVIPILTAAPSAYGNSIWSSMLNGQVVAPSWAAASFIVIFSIFEFVLMAGLPAFLHPTDKFFVGPLTPGGNRPVYRNNCFECALVTVVVYLTLVYFGLINKDYLLAMYAELISSLNIFGLLVAVALYFKGRYWPTHATDARVSNCTVTNFFVGIELHPELFGQQIKVFTNCRFGMTLWLLLLINCLLTRPSPHVIVSGVIMAAYLIKFFYWETGYYTTLDIVHDRCGYYICYGCIAFLPLVYINPVYYQVYHDGLTNLPVLTVICLVGLLSVYFNYAVDAEKQRLKSAAATSGGGSGNNDCAKAVRSLSTATTIRSSHVEKAQPSTAGWWGLARKINYTFEILLSLCWCLPAGFSSIIPYTYFFYITLLLIHRSRRDDQRCQLRYGQAWLAYKQAVPYTFIPYVY